MDSEWSKLCKGKLNTETGEPLNGVSSVQTDEEYSVGNRRRGTSRYAVPGAVDFQNACKQTTGDLATKDFACDGDCK